MLTTSRLQALNRSFSSSCLWIYILFTSTVGRAQSADQLILLLRQEGERLYENQAYPVAKQRYQQALTLSIKYNLIDLAANLLVDLASIEHLDGQYSAATGKCLQGLGLLQKSVHPADSTYFKLYSSLGEYYRQREYLDSSAYYFEKADQILSVNSKLSTQISEYVLYHFSNQSMLHEAIGRFSLSETLALKALRLARKRQRADDIAIVCNVVAGQYERLGKYPEAMALRLEGLQKYPWEDLQRARIYSGIGRNALSQQKLKMAQYFLHRSQRLYQKLHQNKSLQNDVKKVIALKNHLGRCYFAMHRYKEADAYFDQAIKLYRATYGPQGRLIADSWLMKGAINEQTGRPRLALSNWQQALSVVTSPTNVPDAWGNPTASSVLDEKKTVEILLAKGALMNQLNSGEAALHTLQRAMQIFQLARRQLYQLEDKLYLNETILPLHRLALGVAYRFYQEKRTQAAFDTAFSILEQGHATAMQDVIAESVLRPKYIPEDSLRSEQQLRQQLSSIRSQLLENPKPVTRLTLQVRESEVRHKQYLLLQSWERIYPEYTRARTINQPITTQQIKAALSAQTAYISFGFAFGHLHLFAVTQQATSWKVIPVDSTQLYHTLLALRQALTQHPGLQKYQGTPYALQAYEWFIRPLLPLIGSKQEWIVNSGLMDGIPLEALETGKKVNDYLAHHYTIRYTYSAALVAQPPPASPPDNPSILAIAPFTDDSHPALKKRFGYWTLEASRQEMMEIHATPLIGAQATRHQFMSNYENFPIWYFSTHAYLDKSEYSRSFIALYPEDTTYAHRLYADEISQMNLRKLQMVIISACEAGTGKLYASEGIMSLARSFGYAGCPLTINTLWKAHDRSSSFLMKHFLKYLQQGYSPANSLRQARNEFFKSDDNIPYNHPYFWANFIVIGSDTPLYAVAPDSVIDIQLLVNCVLIVIGCFLLYRLVYNHFFRWI